MHKKIIHTKRMAIFITSYHSKCYMSRYNGYTPVIKLESILHKNWGGSGRGLETLHNEEFCNLEHFTDY